MLVKIKFLGLLSVRFGTKEIVVDIIPDDANLHAKIQELLGDKSTTPYVIYKNGRPLKKGANCIEENDAFCVFLTISGG